MAGDAVGAARARSRAARRSHRAARPTAWSPSSTGSRTTRRARCSSSRPTVSARPRTRPLTPVGLRDPAAVLAAFPAPTVAYWDGPAVGAGAELLLAADLRVAGPDAPLAFPEVGAGELPCWGGTQRLPRLAGIAAALRLLVVGDTFAVDELVRVRARRARRRRRRGRGSRRPCSRGAPRAQAAARDAVQRGRDLTLHDALRLEADLNLLIATTDDRAEGIAAFFEKRAPRLHRRVSTARGRPARGSGRVARAGRPRRPPRSPLPADGASRRRPVAARAGPATLPAPGRLLRTADGWVHPGPPTAWADFAAMAMSLGARDRRRRRAARRRRCSPSTRSTPRPPRGCSPRPRCAPTAAPAPLVPEIGARPDLARRGGGRCSAPRGRRRSSGLLLRTLGAHVVRVDDPRRTIRSRCATRSPPARRGSRPTSTTAAGRDAARVRLLGRVDLLVDGYTPRVLANAGLDDDVLDRDFPRLRTPAHRRVRRRRPPRVRPRGRVPRRMGRAPRPAAARSVRSPTRWPAARRAAPPSRSLAAMRGRGPRLARRRGRSPARGERGDG